MSYIKAEKILPEALVREIQRYVEGAYIYIPRKPGNRRIWGQETGYRAELRERNCRICHDHAQGMDLWTLCEKYHLSEKSIRRILRNP